MNQEADAGDDGALERVDGRVEGLERGDLGDLHAEAVDETAEQITSTEHRVTRLVDDAKARIAQISARNEFGDGLHVDPDPLDETLAAFTPPPHGHRDWLDVELPGLDR